MRFYKLLLINLLIVSFVSCKKMGNTIDTDTAEAIDFNYLPTNTTNAVYKHKTYTLSYAEEYEQAEWVAYELDEDDINYTTYDRPFFEVDDEVITGSAHWRNYKNSGYNKGHLCPAGDRKKNFNEYEETFLTSNISPQTYNFNSGIWNRLEQKVRYWAQRYDGVYVVTAGVLEDDLKTIGYEHVAVPKYFYKVVLTKDKKRMIGLLVPHKDSEKSLYSFVVSVDSIEKMTGIDFFPELEDELENELESQSNAKSWKF